MALILCHISNITYTTKADTYTQCPKMSAANVFLKDQMKWLLMKTESLSYIFPGEKVTFYGRFFFLWQLRVIFQLLLLYTLFFFFTVNGKMKTVPKLGQKFSKQQAILQPLQMNRCHSSNLRWSRKTGHTVITNTFCRNQGALKVLV